MNAEIKTCKTCKDTIAAQWQDREYGKHERVHNAFKTKDGKGIKYRCTVCSNERD